jgi:hypothetical protein
MVREKGCPQHDELPVPHEGAEEIASLPFFLMRTCPRACKLNAFTIKN